MINKLTSGYYQLLQYEVNDFDHEDPYAYIQTSEWNTIMEQVYGMDYNGPLVLKLDETYYKTFPREDIDEKTILAEQTASQIYVANEKSIETLFSTTTLSSPVEFQEIERL